MESKLKIYSAIYKFKEIVDPVFKKEIAKVKTKNDCEYRYKFAGLAAIKEVIDEPLHKVGCITVHKPVGKFNVNTQIIHVESGEMIETTFEMIPAGNTPQAQGSTITYQKRFNLVSLLDLQVLDDDDAQKGSERTTEEKQASKSFLKSSDQLKKDSESENFYSKLYQAERACIKSRGSWSLRDFLGSFYEFTSAVIARIEDDYFEYKTSRSLP